MGSKVEHLTDNMSLMRAFIEQQFPGVDWRNKMAAGVSNEVDTSEQVDGDITNEFDNNIEFENVIFAPNDVEDLDSFSYARSKGGGCDIQYVPHEQTIAKQSSVESSAKRSKATCRTLEPSISQGNGANMVDIFQEADNDITNKSVRKYSQPNVNDIPNKKQQLGSFSSARGKDSYSRNVIPNQSVLAKPPSSGTFTQRTKSSRSYVEQNEKGIQPSSEDSCIKRSKTSQMHVASTLPREHGTHKGDLLDQTDNDSTNGFTNNLQDSHANGSTMPNNLEKLNFMVSTGAKEGYCSKALSNQYMIEKKSSIESSTQRSRSSVKSMLPQDRYTKALQRKRVLPDPPPHSDQEVYLFSLNPAYKGKIVAKGNLMTTDRTHVIGGNMLGDEHYGVVVHAVTSIGDEMMPRPFKDHITVKDAIGCVIAWPRFNVKRPKTNSAH